METCIIVPSHINNVHRTKMLITCLESLINQTLKKDIYLSISFETDLDKLLFDKLIEKNNLLENDLIHVVYRGKKTSQFRHIEKLLELLESRYNFVFFIDDDDSYHHQRIEAFNYYLEEGIKFCPKDKIFVGVYELEKEEHPDKYREYWSYCVNIKFIINFMNILKNNNYDYYIDHIMCDVLFSMYLRCLDEKHIFIKTDIKLYNYNLNEYSITHKIQSINMIDESMQKYKVTDLDFFIKELNKRLQEYKESFKNNIFSYYSMNRFTFEEILQKSLQTNYVYRDKIDIKLIDELKSEYDNIKSLCAILYQL